MRRSSLHDGCPSAANPFEYQSFTTREVYHVEANWQRLVSCAEPRFKAPDRRIPRQDRWIFHSRRTAAAGTASPVPSPANLPSAIEAVPSASGRVRRQRFVASGKFTDPGAESGDPGFETRFSAANRSSAHSLRRGRLSHHKSLIFKGLAADGQPSCSKSLQQPASI